MVPTYMATLVIIHLFEINAIECYTFVEAFIVFVAIWDPVTFFPVKGHTWADIKVRNEGAATPKSSA